MDRERSGEVTSQVPDYSAFKMSDEEYEGFVLHARRANVKRELARRTTERWRVFVSYTHADKPHRKSVEEVLRRHDVAYVVDAKDIRISDEIFDWAVKKLRGCSHYLLILSRASVVAPWCVAEYSIARGIGMPTVVYMVDDVVLPPQLGSRIAVVAEDTERLDRYFAHDLIEIDAVDRFLEELLTVGLPELQEYVPLAGRERYWEITSRETRWNEVLDARRQGFVDDYSYREPGREPHLWSIERTGSASWRLEISLGASVPMFHDVYHVRDRRALVMDPGSSDLPLLVGLKEPLGDGTYRIARATGGVEEALDPTKRRLFGWSMSRDFWQYANERLLSQLPKLPGA